MTNSSFNKRAVNLIGLGRKLSIPPEKVIQILDHLNEAPLKDSSPRAEIIGLKILLEEGLHGFITEELETTIYAGFCLGYAMSQIPVQRDL